MDRTFIFTETRKVEKTVKEMQWWLKDTLDTDSPTYDIQLRAIYEMTGADIEKWLTNYNYGKDRQRAVLKSDKYAAENADISLIVKERP